jgi:hypothetical protein
MNVGADQARGSIPTASGAPQPAPTAPAAAAPAAASAPAAPSGNAAPGAGTPAPPAPYSPSTDLTAGQSANYTDWFKNNDDTGARIQQLAQQQAAQGNRKAAYLASMSGGNGGFYQSGQIAAGIRGQQTMQEGLLSNAQARGQIYGDKAAALGSLGMGAQNYNNNLGIQHDTQAFTREQAAGGASQSAAAGNFTTLESQVVDGHPKWGPNSDARRDFDALGIAYKTALANFQASNPTGNPLTDPAVQAAFAAVQGFDPSKYNDDGGKSAATLASTPGGAAGQRTANTLGLGI